MIPLHGLHVAGNRLDSFADADLRQASGEGGDPIRSLPSKLFRVLRVVGAMYKGQEFFLVWRERLVAPIANPAATVLTILHRQRAAKTREPT